MNTSTFNFNPTLVQLEFYVSRTTNDLKYHFNPTLVQLEWEERMKKDQNYDYFNPTLVQLESYVDVAVGMSPEMAQYFLLLLQSISTAQKLSLSDVQ